MTTDVKEFSIDEAKAYLKENNKKSGRFYVNVYGWQKYLTIEPTFATPTGKLKDFPRTMIIQAD